MSVGKRKSTVFTPDTTTADKISNTLYVGFRSIQPTDLFIYIFAIILTMALAQYLKLNIYLSLILAIFIVLIYISKTYVYDTVKKDHLIDHLNAIYPHPRNFDKYPDLIELFYGLKRISELNPLAYADAIYNTDAVIQLYNDVVVGTQSCKYTYDIALDRKVDALNAMDDLIFKAETEKNVTTKVHNAMKTLDQILDAFIDKMKELCDKKTADEGWNIDRHIIFPGPKPYNVTDQYEYFT